VASPGRSATVPLTRSTMIFFAAGVRQHVLLERQVLLMGGETRA
jgi:hypothetical protein